MKKRMAILLAAMMLIGLLSGCTEQKPLSKEEKTALDIQTAEDRLNGLWETDAWASTTTVELSLEGKEFKLTGKESTKTACVGFGTEDMRYHRESTITVDEQSDKQTYHYEDGVGYVNSPTVERKKEAMTAEAFLSFANIEWNDEDINPDEKSLNEGDKWEWNDEGEDVSVMTVKETAMLRVPLILDVFDLQEKDILVQEYLNESEYVFDKKRNPVSMSVHVQCTFESLGETYTVSIELEDQYECGESVKVDELPTKEEYTERKDLAYYQAFLSAYTNAAKLKSHTFKETESFTVTIQERQKYQLVQQAAITPDISIEDAALKQELTGTYTVTLPREIRTSEYTEATYIKKGVVAFNLNGKETKSDWTNPMAFYQTAATGLWRVHHITEADIAAVTFRENTETEIRCSFDMSKAWAKRVGKALFGYTLAQESAEELFAFVKEDDYIDCSGALTYDIETGALTSFQISVKLHTKFYPGRVGECNGTGQYTYKIYSIPPLDAEDDQGEAA